jgi:HEAT repeat protein
VIGALGNLGAAAGDFLVEELLDTGNSWYIRRSCVHSLGVSRDRRAVPYLIDLLTDPRLARNAKRALERIAGRSAGDSPAAWVRWWRTQPEASDGGTPALPE